MLREKLTSVMRELDVNQDGRCSPRRPTDLRQRKHTLGGWLSPVGAYGVTDTTKARTLGLSQVNVLTPGDEFVFHFRSVGLTRLLNIRWQDQPRRFNEGGNADMDGNIHLTDYQIDYTDYDYRTDGG